MIHIYVKELDDKEPEFELAVGNKNDIPTIEIDGKWIPNGNYNVKIGKLNIRIRRHSPDMSVLQGALLDVLKEYRDGGKFVLEDAITDVIHDYEVGGY